MRRRALLTSLATAGAFTAGCLGAGSDAPGDGATSTPTGTTAPDVGTQPSESSEALVVESYTPVSGTNVNVGARGVAKNTSGQWLVDCVLDITGVVDERRFGVRATRSPLAPHGTWEWKVPFGGKADALGDDSPERIVIETRAEFMDLGSTGSWQGRNHSDEANGNE